MMTEACNDQYALNVLNDRLFIFSFFLQTFFSECKKKNVNRLQRRNKILKNKNKSKHIETRLTIVANKQKNKKQKIRLENNNNNNNKKIILIRFVCT